MYEFLKIILPTFVLLAFYHFADCYIDGDIKYSLKTLSMIIEGSSKTYESISIVKYNGRDAYTFTSKELNDLCGGEFSSRNIEIVILVQQTMRFTFSRISTDLQLHFNVLFPSDNHTQRFFKDIRYAQRRHCGEMIDIDKIFKYPKDDSEDKTLFPLSCGNVFYVKHMDSARFEYPKSFNFVRTLTSKTQEADLIIQPQTFNVSHRIGGNKYVLCAYYDQFSVYVLRFPDEARANEFFKSVQNDLKHDIVCPTDWLTPELLQQMDSPVIPAYPHLPYLKPYMPLDRSP